MPPVPLWAVSMESAPTVQIARSGAAAGLRSVMVNDIKVWLGWSEMAHSRVVSEVYD